MADSGFISEVEAKRLIDEVRVNLVTNINLTTALAGKQNNISTDGSLYLGLDGLIRSNITEFKWETVKNPGDTKTITAPFDNVIEWTEIYKRGKLLSESQYDLLPPNKITLIDDFEAGDWFRFRVDHFITDPT